MHSSAFETTHNMLVFDKTKDVRRMKDKKVGNNMSDLKNMPDSYWKEKLTPEQYQVCRRKGTERAFTGALYNNHAKGMYECVACGQPLFSSDAKFESGS